jgi:hypothetical protein
MDNLTARELAFDEFITDGNADALFNAAEGGMSDAVMLARAAFSAGWEKGIGHERYEMLSYKEIINRIS